MAQADIAVIVPYFEDYESFRFLLNDFNSLLLKKTVERMQFFVIDDGSQKSPARKALREATLPGLNIRVISLVGNFGHQIAIFCGLQYVYTQSGFEYTVVMDADGEDTVLNLDKLLESIQSTDSVEVVVSTRARRNETLAFNVFYKIYRFVFRALTGETLNYGNFMVLRKRALSILVCRNTLPLHFAGTVKLSRIALNYIRQDRGPRYVGKSKSDFISQVSHGVRAIACYGNKVSLRIVVVGVFLAFASVVGMASATSLKVLGLATPGWFSISLGVLGLAVLQTSFMTLSIAVTSSSKNLISPLDRNEFKKYVLDICDV